MTVGRPTDEVQMQRFLDSLQELGGKSGNEALRNKLNLSEEEYWRLREKLIEEGKVIRGRGRGGTVTIVESIPAVSVAAPNVAVAETREPRERDLYEPCRRVLHEKWTLERGLRDVFVEITAAQGSKNTGGVWTRPDITAISMRTFTHWPGRVYDIWTFEVKPKWSFNVSGVFEAAAHGRAATHSYAMFEVTKDLDDSDTGVLRLISEAQRLGVGVVFFEQADDFDTWDFKVDPVRRQPDPELLEEFVITQLSQEARNLLLRWGK